MDTRLRDKLTYLRELLDEVADLVTFTLGALHESLLLHAPPHITKTLTQLTKTQQRASQYLSRAYKHYQTASEALGVPSNGVVFAMTTAVATRVIVHMLLARLTLWRIVKLMLVSVVLSLTSSSTTAAALPSVPSASSLATSSLSSSSSSSSPSSTAAAALPASVLSALLTQSPSIALSLSSIAQAYWVVGQQVVSLLLTLSGMNAGSGSDSGGSSDMSGVMGRMVDVVDKLRKETPNSTAGETGGVTGTTRAASSS